AEGSRRSWRVWRASIPAKGWLQQPNPFSWECQEFRARLSGLTDQSMAAVKRSPKRTANWDLAMDHSRGGMIHSFSERFKTRKRSFVAASSLGKWPLALTARRSLEFSASMAFVVYRLRFLGHRIEPYAAMAAV